MRLAVRLAPSRDALLRCRHTGTWLCVVDSGDLVEAGVGYGEAGDGLKRPLLDPRQPWPISASLQSSFPWSGQSVGFSPVLRRPGLTRPGPVETRSRTSTSGQVGWRSQAAADPHPFRAASVSQTRRTCRSLRPDLTTSSRPTRKRSTLSRWRHTCQSAVWTGVPVDAPCGNLHRAGVTGHPLSGAAPDLPRSPSPCGTSTACRRS